MASYPYYQPSMQRSNRSVTPGAARGRSNPRPVNQTVPPPIMGTPAAENFEGPGETASPISESPVYSAEIGREAFQIHLNRDDLLKGLIYSEILGPPKSRRLGRR
jgi:hypothetical protein